MRLLIVDDNPLMRQMLHRLAATFADEICECSDGDEVLNAYRSNQPDWVLMDVRMQRLNGLAATRRLKANFPAARILIVTSFDDVGLRESVREAGASGFVLKQNLDELPRLIEQLDKAAGNKNNV